MVCAGISVRRYIHPDGLPMHAKFLLIDSGAERVAYFGSYNLNLASRYFNDEVLVRSTDAALFDKLLQRFARIGSELPAAPQSASHCNA